MASVEREELTEQERRELEWAAKYGPAEASQGPSIQDELAKALRIIDAHAADRAALVAQLEALQAKVGPAMAALVARLEAAGQEQITPPPEHSSPSGEHGVKGGGTIKGDWRDNFTKTALRNMHPAAVMALDAWDEELRRSHAPTHAALVAQVAELTRERDEALETVCAMTDLASRENAEVTRLQSALAAAERQRDDLARVAMGRASAASYQAESERADVAETHERELRALSLELQQRAEAAEARVRELEARPDPDGQRWLAAEADIAALRVDLQTTLDDLNRKIGLLQEARAEVERQKRLVELAELSATAHRCNATAANALLERVRDRPEQVAFEGGLDEDIERYLAAQPATAPAVVPCPNPAAHVGFAWGAQPATAPARDERKPGDRVVQFGVFDPRQYGSHVEFEEAAAKAQDEAERPCRGCREGTQDRHTCQRAVIPPQTWVPPSGRPPRG